MTVLGALLLFICGLISLSHQIALTVRAGKVGFVTGIIEGSVGLGPVDLPPGFPVKTFDWAFEYHHRPGVNHGFPLPEILVVHGFVIIIPFWLLALIFVLIQYLLLPKSLPVTEECERTD